MGASRDFLTSPPPTALEVRPLKPIFTQNGSIDVDSRKDVPFAVKIATFHTPKFLDLKNFSLELAFNIRGQRENTPYSLSEPNESGIVNRQIGVKVSKFLVVSGPYL